MTWDCITFGSYLQSGEEGAGQKVVWSVDKESVVSLNSKDGTANRKGTINSVTVTGKTAGTAKVTAIVGGDTAHPYEFTVTVN